MLVFYPDPDAPLYYSTPASSGVPTQYKGVIPLSPAAGGPTVFTIVVVR